MKPQAVFFFFFCTQKKKVKITAPPLVSSNSNNMLFFCFFVFLAQKQAAIWNYENGRVQLCRWDKEWSWGAAGHVPAPHGNEERSSRHAVMSAQAWQTNGRERMDRAEGSLPERSRWLRLRRTLRCTGGRTGRTGRAEQQWLWLNDGHEFPRWLWLRRVK